MKAFNNIRFAILGIALCCSAGIAAQPASYPERETIALRSVFGHGGFSSWVMRKADESAEGAAISDPAFVANGWQKAIVPGTVLNSLVANGVYPEPYFGMNNKREEKKIPDISEVGPAFYTYWFRTTFSIPKSFEGRRVWLQLDGINYLADGSPYGSCNPMWYYEDTGSTRGSRINGLCPEYGTPCMPTVDALREMMPEADLWPVNKPVWDYLDGDGFHGMTGLYHDAVRQYGASSNIEEYAFRGQMFGSLAYKAIWENWNANRFEYGDRFSTGLLFWYHNSPHPQTCARLYDWSLEPTAALYSSQNAHEPLHIQFDFLKNTVGVNNELPKAFPNLTATIQILNFDMKEAFRNSVKIDVPPDRFVKDILKVELPKDLSPVYFLKLTLADSAGKVLSDNFYWSSNKPYTPGRTLTGPLFEGMAPLAALPKAAVKSEVSQSQSNGKNFYHVTVSNPSPTLAFMIWLRLQDAKTGKPVRPSFYDDNFYSLLPGESRTVNIEYGGGIDPSRTRLIVDGWNIARKQYENGKVSDLADIRTIRAPSLAQGKPATASSSVEGSTSGCSATSALAGSVSHSSISPFIRSNSPLHE
jgi:hypothetical protein